MTFAIQTESLGRSFNGVQAVADLDLHVQQGTIFGFLGPNGAGKTTTIRLLLGLLEPTAGSAHVLGYDTRSHAGDIRLRSGALLEYNGLYERLSAVDNLDFYGRVWRLPPAARRDRIKELLSSMGLWERRHEIVGRWSRGMKQKLAVARVLLHRPALVFMDEPTAGLDPVAAAALHEDLLSLANREGVTVFLTTHNLAEAEKLCRVIGVIREGRLMAVGEPEALRRGGGAPHVEISGRGFTPPLLEALRTRPEVAGADVRNGRLVLSLKDNVDIAPLVGLIVAAGGQIEEVNRSKASLEEVFLALVEDDAHAE